LTAKFLPLNIRLMVLKQEDLQGMPSLMAAIPNDPTNPAKFGTQPCRLQIALIDPDDGKEKWYDVPFTLPEKSIIELDMPVMPRGKRN
jgi:hypothetical protein